MRGPVWRAWFGKADKQTKRNSVTPSKKSKFTKLTPALFFFLPFFLSLFISFRFQTHLQLIIARRSSCILHQFNTSCVARYDCRRPAHKANYQTQPFWILQSSHFLCLVFKFLKVLLFFMSPVCKPDGKNEDKSFPRLCYARHVPPFKRRRWNEDLTQKLRSGDNVPEILEKSDVGKGYFSPVLEEISWSV